MATAELILEYAKVLLSAAPIAGLVGLVFLIAFRDDLRALMRRIGTIRFPGGELSVTQAERASEAATTAPESAPPAASTDTSSLPQNFGLSPEDQQRVIEFLQAERARAALWEYRYLNLFLVPHTQRVLDWLVSLGQRTTAPTYDARSGCRLLPACTGNAPHAGGAEVSWTSRRPRDNEFVTLRS